MPLSHVVGHKRLTTLISRAIERGTLPPTLMFVGPHGVGKWVVARAAAQAMNCLSPVRTAAFPHDACGECRSCDRIERGVHVDVFAVEPDDKASIKIDVVREVLGHTGYRPFEGRQRFVLVREADTLEPGAQNALLKSLEEPPPGTVFILTTTVPSALLPTVRSRCMRMRFGQLTTAEAAQLQSRDADEVEKERRDRDAAMRLLKQVSARADAQSRLQAAANLVGMLSKKEERGDLAAILRMAASMLRDIEVINAGADGRVLANPVIEDDLSSLAKAYTGDRARSAFGAIDKALAAIERNAGTKLIAEWLAVQM
jgi:DNA polymerase-3 subunit delta'